MTDGSRPNRNVQATAAAHPASHGSRDQGRASTEIAATGMALPAPTVSTSLLAAAIGGLLCMSGCGSDDSDDKQGHNDQDGGGDVEERKVTLTRKDPSMTKETFETACDEADGKLEIHPQCGGANTCKGFSYDTDIGVYTEHTCMGLNTCTGWSCVVPDEA